MINNPTYSTKSNARRGAEVRGIVNFEINPTEDGRYELKDLDRPLYNHDARTKSTVESPVSIVWDLCCKMGAKAKDSRKEIISKAVEMGVSLNTAKSQYQSWRKSAGYVKS